jgi:protein-disulfide isomerase
MSSRKHAKKAGQLLRAEQAARRRRRTIWACAIVAAVLVLAGGTTAAVVVAQQKSQADQRYALPAGATRDNLGLPVSQGPVSVDVYLDFMCPNCQEFQQLASTVLTQFTGDGKIRLVYHPVNLDDRYSSGTRYSTRAAAAAGCAADADKLPDFVSALYGKEPAQHTAGLTDKQIVQLGKGAGIVSADFSRCVTAQKYAAWVAHVSNQATQQGVHDVPAVFVNNQRIDATVTALTNAINNA